VPYIIYNRPNVSPKDEPWKIYDVEKKKIIGSSFTKEDARLSIRARFIEEYKKERKKRKK